MTSGRKRPSAVPTPEQQHRPFLDLMRLALSRDLTDEDFTEWRAEADKARAQREADITVGCQNVVYYLRFADRIKIGTTRDIRTRLLHVPHDEVLALEPGSYEIERLRHQQWAHVNRHGEWFSATPELLAFAAGLKRQHPWDPS